MKKAYFALVNYFTSLQFLCWIDAQWGNYFFSVYFGLKPRKWLLSTNIIGGA